MKVLIITDCHDKLTMNNLENHTGLAENLTSEKPDIALYLGDCSDGDVENVKEWLTSMGVGNDIPVYGIFGNHDTPSLLSRNGIENIHLKTVEVHGIRILGFGGCVKYKDNSSAVLYSQEESIQLLSQLPKCDILITHSNPQYRQFETVDVTPEPKSLAEKIKRKIFGYEPITEQRACPLQNNCHSGLVGIGDYIEIQQPAMCIHGHIHDRSATYHSATEIRSCYGVEIIEI